MDGAPPESGAPDDTTPPRLSRTVVDGTKLTLAFNEAIDDAASPANGAFTVKKTPPGGSEETVGLSGSPAVEGARVTLSLAKAVRGADTGVKVSYRKSGSDADDRLRDESGNEVAEFSDEPVANSADTTPAVAGVAITSDAGADRTYGPGDTIRVRLTFNAEVNVTGTPRLMIYFSLGAGDRKWAVYASGSGTKRLEFAYTVARGDGLSAGVGVFTNSLELDGGTIKSTAAAGENAALAHRGLWPDSAHKVDARPPTLSVASVNGATLRLTFDEALGAAASLATGVFAVKKTPQGGSEQDVSLSGSPAIRGATVILTLANAVLETDTDVKVSYARPTSGTGNRRLRDAFGNEVAGFTDEPVRNVTGDTTPPRLLGGEIDGGTVTLYFSEALDPDSKGGWYQVDVGRRSGWCRTVAKSAVEIDVGTVTVGLGGGCHAKAGTARNTLWYGRPTDGATGLRDLAGNEVGTGQKVTLHNSTGAASAASVIGVAVSSDAGDDDTYAAGETVRVRLTFNAAVEVTGAPRVNLDLSSEAGDERWADYASGSGTKVLEFAWTVAEGDESSAGVAVLANTLALNGGTIRHVAWSKDAGLSHAALGHDPSHKVDGITPTLSAATVDGSTLTLTFSETLAAAASLSNSFPSG